MQRVTVVVRLSNLRNRFALVALASYVLVVSSSVHNSTHLDIVSEQYLSSICISLCG
jgi:hypothetical protein